MLGAMQVVVLHRQFDITESAIALTLLHLQLKIEL
jgi:hypothetical protein